MQIFAVPKGKEKGHKAREGRISSAVEHFTRNEGVPSSNLGFGSQNQEVAFQCNLFFMSGSFDEAIFENRHKQTLPTLDHRNAAATTRTQAEPPQHETVATTPQYSGNNLSGVRQEEDHTRRQPAATGPPDCRRAVRPGMEKHKNKKAQSTKQIRSEGDQTPKRPGALFQRHLIRVVTGIQSPDILAF